MVPTTSQEGFAKFMASTKGPTPTSAPGADVPAVPTAAQPADPAFDILAKHQELANGTKGDLWQHFNDAPHSRDLIKRLIPYDAPISVKDELLAAKQATDPVPTHMDKIVEAIYKLASMNPQARSLAESHPAILKAFLSAGEN